MQVVQRVEAGTQDFPGLLQVVQVAAAEAPAGGWSGSAVGLAWVEKGSGRLKADPLELLANGLLVPEKEELKLEFAD